MLLADKVYLIRYQDQAGAWCMGLVRAWDAYQAVSILARRKRAKEVEKPKNITNHLIYYRDNLRIEEVN